jgi:predicted phosphodiesterase
MKLAIISDIHANLPALEAVFRDIEKENPDEIYCLGDLVNFAGWDNEVIDLIRQRNILTIQGNHDEGIGHGKTDFPFSYSSPAQKEFGLASIQNVNKDLSDDHRSYLRNLPFSAQLEYRFPFHPVRLTLTHGSPLSNNDYIQPESGAPALSPAVILRGGEPYALPARDQCRFRRQAQAWHTGRLLHPTGIRREPPA